jgi:hypothetical protein
LIGAKLKKNRGKRYIKKIDRNKKTRSPRPKSKRHGKRRTNLKLAQLNQRKKPNFDGEAKTMSFNSK